MAKGAANGKAAATVATALVELPLSDEHEGYIESWGGQIKVDLDEPLRSTFRRIQSGLVASRAKLRNSGRYDAGMPVRSAFDVIKWLVEQVHYADQT